MSCWDKSDLYSYFGNQNTCCRLCNSADESIYHIVNCGQEVMIPFDSISKIYNENINIEEATEIADRIEKFIKEDHFLGISYALLPIFGKNVWSTVLSFYFADSKDVFSLISLQFKYR